MERFFYNSDIALIKRVLSQNLAMSQDEESESMQQEGFIEIDFGEARRLVQEEGIQIET